jgi:hypothetical protein
MTYYISPDHPKPKDLLAQLHQAIEDGAAEPELILYAIDEIERLQAILTEVANIASCNHPDDKLVLAEVAERARSSHQLRA